MSSDVESQTLSNSSVAAQWARFKKTLADLERRGEAAPEEAWDDLFRMEKHLLGLPVDGRADAVAKLEAVARSLAAGERHDGADQEAVASVIRWLLAP